MPSIHALVFLMSIVVVVVAVLLSLKRASFALLSVCARVNNTRINHFHSLKSATFAFKSDETKINSPLKQVATLESGLPLACLQLEMSLN